MFQIIIFLLSLLKKKYPQYGLLIYDIKSKLKTEILLPTGCGENFVVLKDKIIVFNRLKSDNIRKIIFDVFELGQDISKTNYLSQLDSNQKKIDSTHKNELNSYMKRFFGANVTNFAVVDLDESCEDCLGKLKENLKTKRIKSNCGILVISDKYERRLEFMKYINSNKKSNFIFSDTRMNYHRESDPFVNVISFELKGNEKINLKQYNPRNFGDFEKEFLLY